MPSQQSQNLIVVPASKADRQTVANLLQLYLYDMASTNVFPIAANGLYAYDFLERFWEHPYLIYQNGALAGFALVTSQCQITNRSPCWFMAEFFVLRPYRNKGLGRQAVEQILALHPGPWHVANLNDNSGADAFWSNALPSDFSQRHLKCDGSEWTLRAFNSAKGSV